MSQIKGFKGFFGYSIRELSLNETNLYCSFNRSVSSFPYNMIKTNLTSDFSILAYTSGCYYYDVNTGKWSSNGMEIYKDTNLEETHCFSNHLTLFAGGLSFASSIINYQYTMTKAVLNNGQLVYASLILVTCVYILFAIWSKYMDTRDLKKLNLIPLKDNNPNDNYFYELIVFTGNQSESGTQSKVIYSIKFVPGFEIGKTLARSFKIF